MKTCCVLPLRFFFFQAEDGIRDGHVTGVQTCALPISFFSCVGGRRRDASEAGGGGVAGMSAAWMPRPSPQGWVHGVPREPTVPSLTRAFRDQPSTPEGLRRSREPTSPATTTCRSPRPTPPCA